MAERGSPVAALRAEHRGAVATDPLEQRLAHAARRRSQYATEPWAVRWLLPDLLGGVTSYALDLAAARPPNGPRLELCWIRGGTADQARNVATVCPRVERIGAVDHVWPGENLFALLRRMHRVVTPGPGVLIANELFGLAYAASSGAGRHVVQILHGDIPMYYALAEQFEPYVDVFVTVSARICEELGRRLPGRVDDIRHLSSGVPIPDARREAQSGPLRLVYNGRLDAAKGLGDLPEIDRLVAAAGVDVRWTFIGAGPDEAELRAHFEGDARVGFTGALPPDEARARLQGHDVLVLPSRGEGLSLALLEAMAAGVVPVASDLESGMREVVDPEQTGLLAAPEEPEAFATAIVRLAQQPELLERLSQAASARVREHHAIKPRAAAFYALLTEIVHRPLPPKPPYRRGPSRLDRPWLPNLLVRAVRRLAR